MSHSGIVESRTFNLPVDNIDTDQIIPGQFLTTTERDGLESSVFTAGVLTKTAQKGPITP